MFQKIPLLRLGFKFKSFSKFLKKVWYKLKKIGLFDADEKVEICKSNFKLFSVKYLTFQNLFVNE